MTIDYLDNGREHRAAAPARGTPYWADRRLLITGATAGLGRALTLAALARGARVVAVGRDDARLADLERAAVPRLPETLHLIQADVADQAAIYRIAGEAVGALGGIDLLVNNASYLGATPLRLLVDSDCEDLAAALATNTLAPFRLTKALLPGMLLRGTGMVVNVSSDAAVSAYETWGGYSISKAATDQLSRVFDAELARRGIRFLALDPGDMATAMHFAAIPDADPAALRDPAVVAEELLDFLSGAAALAEVRFTASGWRQALAQSGGGRPS